MQPVTRKQCATMYALHVGITHESSLAANTLWSEDYDHGCSVTSLVPVGVRENPSERAKMLTDPSWWAKWDKDILYLTANENNRFVVTDKERQVYMEAWTNRMHGKLLDNEQIITEASDLSVPHFEVPEPVAEATIPMPELREVAVR